MAALPNDLTPDEKAALLRDLRESYYSGASRIRFRERDVTFRSQEEMKAIIDDLAAEVSPGQRKQRVIVTTFDRGY